MVSVDEWQREFAHLGAELTKLPEKSQSPVREKIRSLFEERENEMKTFYKAFMKLHEELKSVKEQLKAFAVQQA